MPIIAGLVIGVFYFAVTVACRGPWGSGTLWPGHLAFGPLALLAEKLDQPALEFYAGPLLYPVYGVLLGYALRTGWARRALIELGILHYTCFAFLIPALLKEESFSEQVKSGRVNPWLLGSVFLFFVLVHTLAFRFATGRGVRKWLPAPRFSLRTMLAAVMLAASIAALWRNCDAWILWAKISAPEVQIQFMSFSGDSRRVIGILDDGMTRIWDASTGVELASHASHTSEIQCYADSPEGPIAAVLGPDDVQSPEGPDIPAELGQALKGTVTFEMVDTPLKEAIEFVCSRKHLPFEFSQQAKDMQIPEANVNLRVADMERTQALRWLVRLADGEIRFQESSILILARREFEEMERDNVRIWRLEDDVLLRSLPTPGARELVLAANSRRALTSGDLEGRFLDVSNGKLLAAVKLKNRHLNPEATAFSADGTKAAISLFDGEHASVLMVDLQRGAEMKSLQQEDGFRKLLLSPDGSHLCVYPYNRGPSLINVSSGVKVGELGGVFSPDGTMIYDSRYQEEAESGTIFRASTGEIQARLRKYGNLRRSVFFQDGRRLLTAYDYYGLTVWDTTDGTLLADLPRTNGPEFSAYLDFSYFSGGVALSMGPPAPFEPRISRDGEKILSEAEGHMLKVWSRRRPEWWWGYAWLPEFWIMFVLGLGFVWSVGRDWREIRR